MHSLLTFFANLFRKNTKKYLLKKQKIPKNTKYQKIPNTKKYQIPKNTKKYLLVEDEHLCRFGGAHHAREEKRRAALGALPQFGEGRLEPRLRRNLESCPTMFVYLFFECVKKNMVDKVESVFGEGRLEPRLGRKQLGEGPRIFFFFEGLYFQENFI